MSANITAFWLPTHNNTLSSVKFNAKLMLALMLAVTSSSHTVLLCITDSLEAFKQPFLHFPHFECCLVALQAETSKNDDLAHVQNCPQTSWTLPNLQYKPDKRFCEIRNDLLPYSSGLSTSLLSGIHVARCWPLNLMFCCKPLHLRLYHYATCHAYVSK